LAEETKARIESELEVKAYIQDLKFALVVSFCREGIYSRNVPL